MSLKKRLTAIGIIAIVAAAAFGIAGTGRQISEKQEETIFTGEKETVYLWYTDEALTSYLSGAAVTYNETHDVRVVPVLESGLEYLEKINQASLENSAPDLYIISHESLPVLQVKLSPGTELSWRMTISEQGCRQRPIKIKS